MAFKPNTTAYLCSGTGLDMEHSVWMHKYAYSDEVIQQAVWWNPLFQWFKAHSIAEGYWYYTFIDPYKGYIDVGRTPLSTGSAGEQGLGNAAKQVELDSPNLQYSEALRGVDWVVFANGSNGTDGDATYCLVNNIEYINHNVARIHFTVDAILTYQKYFNLKQCFVDRDMQFNEWKPTSGLRSDQTPTLEAINTMPEAVGVSETDYVMQKIGKDSENSETLEKLTSFGAYNSLFCTTDVNLDTVKRSEFSSVVPDFEPSDSSKVGDVNLGIGVYQVKARVNKGFTALGSLNAMEHILSSYMLPSKVVEYLGGECPFVSDLETVIKDDYKSGHVKKLKLPTFFTDGTVINRDHEGNSFKPVNFKCYTAPLTYLSISDKQGSSFEIPLQQIIPSQIEAPTSNCYYTLGLDLNITAAPNMPSNLHIINLMNATGSEENPFMTLWQCPSYVMTPNNSGYAQEYANNLVKTQAKLIPFAVTGALLATAFVIGTGGTGAAVIAGVVAGGGAGMGAGTAIGHTLYTSGSDITTDAYSLMKQKSNMQEIGLPKAVGGIPNNMTSYTMNNAGYVFYWCHLKTEYMKLADYMFSIIGYAQNCFRYPHINTRKRWCYVKLNTVNICGIPANNYDVAGVPFWARSQIEQRLKNGVTFWNLRHAMGDSPIQDYKAMPESIIKMNFVRNYGTSVRSPEILDNADHDGDYASDYSDEA